MSKTSRSLVGDPSLPGRATCPPVQHGHGNSTRSASTGQLGKRTSPITLAYESTQRRGSSVWSRAAGASEALRQLRSGTGCLAGSALNGEFMTCDMLMSLLRGRQQLYSQPEQRLWQCTAPDPQDPALATASRSHRCCACSQIAIGPLSQPVH